MAAFRLAQPYQTYISMPMSKPSISSTIREARNS
nr:MAG TPA: hypothetical protein [Caudoviricetes sp.]